MLSEIELQRFKRARSDIAEITSKLVPNNAIQCAECGCQLLWADNETGYIHCGGCNVQLDGGLNLEDE